MKISVGFLGDPVKKADLLIAGVFEGAQSPLGVLRRVDPGAYEVAARAIRKKRFNGKAGERVATFDGALRSANELVLFGLGKKSVWTHEKLRTQIGTIFNQAKSQRAAALVILADSFAGGSAKLADAAELIPETLELAAYAFDKYKAAKKDGDKPRIKSVELLYADKAKRSALEKALERAGIIADAVNFTRTLINEPANVLTPREMASRAKQAAREGKFKCTVLGKAEIARKQMGGIIGVSQGSSEPPQLLVLEYGVQHKRKGTVCLVGKGVVFDTGGISIKPSANMEKMKYDMSGAAAVIGTLKAVSRLKPALHVVGIAPCVENMPSGTAQRPGDIIKMHNGKSVEVINTDAEGRLILGDALSYAGTFKPKAIIDLATLTGAVIVALADKAIGLMGTDPALVKKIKRAGETTGEKCWELPLWDEYGEMIKGHHSDILNVASGGGAGTITAAMFLKEFVPVKSWAHLDIAGTAWANANKPYNVKGATGVGVRLLVELLSRWR